MGLLKKSFTKKFEEHNNESAMDKSFHSSAFSTFATIILSYQKREFKPFGNQ